MTCVLVRDGFEVDRFHSEVFHREWNKRWNFYNPRNWRSFFGDSLELQQLPPDSIERFKAVRINGDECIYESANPHEYFTAMMAHGVVKL